MNCKTILSLSLAVLMVASVQLYAQSGTTGTQRQTSLGQRVPDANSVSMGAIDHSSWNQLLTKYVDEAGGVNYSAWKASQEDSAALDQYINQLSAASLTKPATRENQMAYWINAYNAVTIKGILQEYPTSSIRNFTDENGGYNVWKNLLLNIGGRQISLEGIEHKALRPMGDPRIHFAIVCASKGCPRLLNEAYVGETLNEQMDRNEAQFFSLPENFQYDAQTRSMKLSTIMKWYGSDFGADQATQLRSLAKYLPTPEAQAAANANAVNISYLDYSWDLNEQKAQPAAGSGAQQGSSTQTQGSATQQTQGSASKQQGSGTTTQQGSGTTQQGSGNR